MNIDKRILACHQSILYNFSECNCCNKIKFKVLRCINCSRKLCEYCIKTSMDHIQLEKSNVISCLPAYSFPINNIAIGNDASSYDNFDIIVNLNYPANNVAHMEIQEVCVDNKHIYKIGLLDNSNENILEIFDKLIPKLIENFTQHVDKKILFHCKLGLSRSVSFAILFISLIHNITLDSSFNLIKSIRPNVSPNHGFIKALYMYKSLNR